MLITPAYAQAAGGGGSSALLQILPFIAIFAIMYFLIIRPQQKRVKQHQEMVNALSRGDTVVTAGGLIGKVVKITNDNDLLVELASDVRVKVVRGTIAEVRTKGKPVDDKS
ncbi:MAG: preprotein translocase subunit YajC [bacterium]|nr:preprotein translocase subunit YajC [bacterium]